MLKVYVRTPAGALSADPNALPHGDGTVWVDLDQPTDAEELQVETSLGVDVPIPAERGAEEDSARFYEEDGALVLTATLLGRREEGHFISDAVTFILARGKLITVRRIRPRAFEIGQGRASARVGAAQTGAEVLTALLAGVIERLADLIAETRASARDLSAQVFADRGAPPLRASLRTLGRFGALAALCQESLASLQRLATYAALAADRFALPKDQLATFARDVAELERSAAALETQLNLLQEATLGLVGAQQNDTLKALALATIAFAPPTLVASIFGMNFEAMDWFRHGWGPWAGFALMLAAPMTLFFIARWRRWF